MAYLLDIKTLSAVSNNLRGHGDKTVLTHGAFDLFHIGHSTFLKESKKKGDVLIVGLESDKRISKYKLTGRPVIPLEQRIRVLLENKSVDFVFSIDSVNLSENYYLKLYERLSASVVTCGLKFTYIKQFKKRKSKLHSHSSEFKVIRHKYENVQSTTRIIKKIKEQIAE
jgi:cytidyltransferase-like protein